MKTLEKTAYYNARNRCTNPKDAYYSDYGGRGIEFRFTSFKQFIDALRTPENPSGLRPSPEHTLDRKNNDGHYEAGNIRWATYYQQSRNQRQRHTKGIPWTPERA